MVAINVVGRIGAHTLSTVAYIGITFIFICRSLKGMLTGPFYWKIFLQQLKNIGFYSLPLIGLTSLFTGAVLALQTYSGFSRFSAESTIPIVVVLSITRELAPVLSGLVISGRVGASIAAEIATMRVTEQIDALYTLSTDSIKYLITPRLLASIIALPFLVIIADIVGIMGGYIVSVSSLKFNSSMYIVNSFKHLKIIDVISGLTKAAFFGFAIAIISCFFGYHATKGAQGVGKATTQSVVISSVVILLSNYFITQLFI